MSAFIVPVEHIRAMVNAGLVSPYGPLSWHTRDLIEAERERAYRSREPWGPDAVETVGNVPRVLTPATAGAVGAMLLAENRRSVDYRYNEAEIEEVYTHGPSRLRQALEILKAINCYEYQSCETSDWGQSEAYQFCQALRGLLVGQLPGYDEADSWPIQEPWRCDRQEPPRSESGGSCLLRTEGRWRGNGYAVAFRRSIVRCCRRLLKAHENFSTDRSAFSVENFSLFGLDQSPPPPGFGRCRKAMSDTEKENTMTIPPTGAGRTIIVTGYPLPAPVTFHDTQPDHAIHGEGWLLGVGDAMRLLEAWKDAPGESDVTRDWMYSGCGVLVTALYFDGEMSLSVWESAIGSDGADLYSTVTMPFDFEVQEQGAMNARTVYRPDQFTDSGWDSGTPEKKARFVNALIRFIDQGYPEVKFSKSLYDGLYCHGYFGFIAHYDRAGFYAEQFSTVGRQEVFFDDLMHDCGQGAHTQRWDLWADVKRILLEHYGKEAGR